MGTQLALFPSICEHAEAELCGAGWLWCPNCETHGRPADVDPLAAYQAEDRTIPRRRRRERGPAAPETSPPGQEESQCGT